MSGGIAIAGRAASGKSHLAREVVTELQELGYRAEVVSFATALKEEVWDLYGVRKGMEGSRELLISHGESMNERHPGYWVAKLKPVVLGLWSEGIVPVCDDLRRYHEYQWLGACGFYRVRVTADELLRRDRLFLQNLDPNFATSTDPTEAEHERWLFDSRFESSSLRDLRYAAHRLVANAIERGCVS